MHYISVFFCENCEKFNMFGNPLNSLMLFILFTEIVLSEKTSQAIACFYYCYFRCKSVNLTL